MSRWLRTHPYTGWYIAVTVTADFVLHLAETLGR